MSWFSLNIDAHQISLEQSHGMSPSKDLRPEPGLLARQLQSLQIGFSQVFSQHTTCGLTLVCADHLQRSGA
jgi:hypothetical protein